MINMKLVISVKNGQTFQTELSEDKSVLLTNKKISDVIDGEVLGIPGYKLKITGGSDSSGFPMRPEVEGTKKYKLLLSKGPGYKPKRRGERKRKTVRGNTVDQSIIQVNTKAIEEGPTPLSEIFPKKEEKKE
ncbi:30S ribosomal protein S6e [Candidatus Micrarchaeota archaeon]|nr:30S ribosomal protein S6e [Candidatus Micrarchaeota archaeon]